MLFLSLVVSLVIFPYWGCQHLWFHLARQLSWFHPLPSSVWCWCFSKSWSGKNCSFLTGHRLACHSWRVRFAHCLWLSNGELRNSLSWESLIWFSCFLCWRESVACTSLAPQEWTAVGCWHHTHSQGSLHSFFWHQCLCLEPNLHAILSFCLREWPLFQWCAPLITYWRFSS